MGEVYRARDIRLDRPVAIKILSPQLARDPAFRQQFEHEARVVSQLNHPNICTLYDLGESKVSGESIAYLVMELVDGETLSARLARAPLSLDQAIAAGAQIADALEAAHRRGIVHRDLKPANVMLTRAGIKLLDFGLAERRASRLVPGWSSADTRTMPLAAPGLMGTMQYLAPEQLEGKDADTRTDIFACGAVIYEMVAQRPAFDGDNAAEVMAAIIRCAPQPLTAVQPQVPGSLEHAVHTCLAKDPDERWQHAGDLARELRWIGAAPRERIPRHGRERVAGRLAVGVAAALLVVSGWLAWHLLSAPAAGGPLYRTSVVLPDGLRFPAPGGIGGAGRFAISPDGRRLAFVAVDASGNQMLWLRAMDALAASPLAGTDGAASPFWSPDSGRIAFIAQGQLKTVDLGGGSPAVVASPALNATGAWNRDDVILFTPTAASPLHQVRAGGGPASPVTILDRDAGDVLHRNPAFLPDGRHFLYVAAAARADAATGPRAVYVGSLAPGEQPRQLVDMGSIAKYAQGHVIFLRDDALFARPFDLQRLEWDGEAHSIAGPVELNGPASTVFSVADTGVLAYQPADARGSRLAWLDREARQLASVGEPAEYGDIELSPDGRLAAVSVLDAGTNTRDLWVFDLARGVRSRLTFDRADQAAPSWSPDGARLFFASNARGHFDVYSKAASGIGAETLVFADGSEKYPMTVTPDGRALVYWQFDTNGATLSRLALVGDPRPVTILPSPVGPGRLSPDGRWLAYSSAESGRSEIYVVPYPSLSRRWQVSTAGGSLPRWRRDGRELLYAGRDNRLMSVPLTDEGRALAVGEAQPLFELRPVGPRSFFDVSADGRRFLVNVLAGEGLSSTIAVVQNWLVAGR
jgi:Tol biopolymer transport system component